MSVMVIGSGGREHALMWRLVRDGGDASEVIGAPGNPGMAQLGECVDANVRDADALAELAVDVGARLVVVGPEQPLVDGLADRLQARDVAVFGPTASAARLEGSKHFANELMRANGVPCPASRTFDAADAAIDYVYEMTEGSVVVKADGLAAGKGVTVPETRADAVAAIVASIDERVYGDAGASVVIEERLVGPELSVFGFVDGESVSELVAARDYKRAGDGDVGPNTGGMGAYTSPELASEALLDDIRVAIFEPIAVAMARLGCPYQGVLYAGLMLTERGPQVIEFNCRFGDPECEPLMMRLDCNLGEVCHAVSEGRLDEVEVRYSQRHCVAVVTVSGGYPGGYETGYPIAFTGELAQGDDEFVFHAGTALTDDGELVTAGGRVLVSTAASAVSVADARERAYRLASQAVFEGARYRGDIAADGVVDPRLAGFRR